MSELKSTNLDDDQSEPEFAQYKVIIVGDGAVGKTSLVLRFAEDAFGKQYKQTIGVDFFVKRVMLPQNVEVRLQLWDIGGQSIGAKMLSNYIYGSDAIVFVYNVNMWQGGREEGQWNRSCHISRRPRDVTNYQSFQNLEDWMQLVNNTVAGSECLKVLVANKSDLDHLRAVKKEKHEDYTEEHFMNKWSFYVSAKTGDQVEPTFVRIAAELAGINLSYNDLIAREKQVDATIVAHPRHDPKYNEVNAEDIKAGRKCAIM